jgi:hypothetical protein
LAAYFAASTGSYHLLESQSVIKTIIQGLVLFFANFNKLSIHKRIASQIAVHTKFIVGGKSAIVVFCILFIIAKFSFEKGTRIKGIQEKNIIDISYQGKSFKIFIIVSFAALNL